MYISIKILERCNTMRENTFKEKYFQRYKIKIWNERYCKNFSINTSSVNHCFAQ